MPNEKDNNESIQQELHATRKVGLPRYFEMVGRDLWAFYRAGFLCAVGFLPGAVLLWFGLMGGSALYSLPVSAAVMILYPALDKAFKLEQTLAARRDAELDDYMADNDR